VVGSAQNQLVYLFTVVDFPHCLGDGGGLLGTKNDLRFCTDSSGGFVLSEDYAILLAQISKTKTPMQGTCTQDERPRDRQTEREREWAHQRMHIAQNNT